MTYPLRKEQLTSLKDVIKNVKPKKNLGLHSSTMMMYQKNIRDMYLSCTKSQVKQGIKWYKEANKTAYSISTRSNVSLDKVCQIIAVLSPSVSWEQNVLDAQALCLAYNNNEDLEKVTVSTYGQNKTKAINILSLPNFLIPKTGLKTYSFYKNMLDPFGSGDYVTIDRHAFKAMIGTNRAGDVNINAKSYIQAVYCYSKVALEMGLEPCELQAVVWLNQRANTIGNT